MGVPCVTHGREVNVGLLVGSFEGKEPYKAEGRRENNIKMDFMCDGNVWTGLFWLRIGISGGLF
jgi:hypothetical protein